MSMFSHAFMPDITPHAVERERIVTQARSVGIDDTTIERIVAEVEEEAKTSTTWGTLKQRNDEIRQRLTKALWR
ncbi:hypothetical protein [Methylorubrum extorquens]|uniref:hypothetical protein n=1 Tax=Methylorubrum extorquens TaxID=408 RepID=UPI00209EB56C|nr:hypothetical protein [Methylorubrum extorquens]MCP1540131.1 hypothetical protein [Methylorubrum extorquens]